MSFRDSARLKPANARVTPHQGSSESQAEICVTLACDSSSPLTAQSPVSLQSCPPGDRRVVEADESEAPSITADGSKTEGLDGYGARQRDTAVVGGTCSDASSLRSAAERPGSSSYESVSSSAGGVGHASNRIIYPSAPITFTKSLTGGQQWGAYTRTASGYLNAETLRAAAAADERAALCQTAEPPVSASIARERSGDEGGDRRAEEVFVGSGQEGKRKSTTDAINSCSEQFQSGFSNAVSYASSRERKSYALPGPRSIGQRAFLGSWILGGGETATEIERLLRQENDLAEAVAARSELAKRKLVQEDMEAMIENLQQVKSFLVQKLRECETALLTTAQERDGLESTLQHIQSGIQDSVAENRRLVDDYKSQLAAKTAVACARLLLQLETETLGDQLRKAMKEIELLKRENKNLLNEVAAARAEVVDVAAARGFHIEEYQHAIHTLMERNKTQHRELKRLRRQLIKTREDYANALARLDELESVVEFQRSALPDEHLVPTRRSRNTWRIPGMSQHRRTSRELADHSQPVSEASSSRSSQQPDTLSDRNHGTAACGSDQYKSERHPEPETPMRDTGKRCGALSRCSDAVGELSGPAGIPRAGALGSSVTGLLASGVTRVLQSLGRAVSEDREVDDTTVDNPDRGSSEPTGAAQLHEEAALFVQRTSSSRDIVINLEGGSDSQSDEAKGECMAGEMETSALSNVARSMWQAAHEMLADRALPPARLSTLRTIASSSPSAWEVILERHRAARSMPLFSSIPPAAFPLVEKGRNERRDVSQSGARSTSASPARNCRSFSSGHSRRHSRRPPLMEGLNVRQRGRNRKVSRESQLSGTVSVELQRGCAEVQTELSRDTGEVVVWQEASETSSRPATGPRRGLSLRIGRGSRSTSITLVQRYKRARQVKAMKNVGNSEEARGQRSPANQLWNPSFSPSHAVVEAPT